jgi:hypothetical protein
MTELEKRELRIMCLDLARHILQDDKIANPLEVIFMAEQFFDWVKDGKRPVVISANPKN